MRIILLLTLALTVSVSTQTCGRGGLPCDRNQCHYPPYIQGCLSYTINNTCSSCLYNYILSNGHCFYSPTTTNSSSCCLQFDQNSKCIQCAPGLSLNVISGLCQDVKIEGCLKIKGKGCQICAKEYQNVEGFCVKAVQGCVRYDLQLACAQCNNGRQLYLGVCLPKPTPLTIPNCQLYYQFGCAKCKSGYSTTRSSQCSPSILGCFQHTSTNQCAACLAPYFINQNGKCIVVGCQKSNEVGVCQLCDAQKGFVLRNGRCQIDGCLYFDQHGCQICADGRVAGSWGCRLPQAKVCMVCRKDQYEGNDGVCRPKDPYCKQYSNGQCLNCYQNYYLTSSGCKQAQPGCIYTNNLCTSCSSPFTYIPSSNSCQIFGCLQYCAQGCLQCDSKLQLSSYSCGLPNCQTINNNYQCQQCKEGYELDFNKQCIIKDVFCIMRNGQNICVKCQEGYQLNTQNKCVSLKFGCNYVDGRCTSCRAPFVYVVERQSCQIDGCGKYFVGGCEVCGQGYSLIYNTCKLPNCLVSKQGKCLQCDPDYIFNSSGLCVSKDQFCQKMDQYGTCIKCMSSYHYSTKLSRCIKKSPGCTYDSNDLCISCSLPFIFDSGRCLIKGCLRMDQQGCYECQYPWALLQDYTCGIRGCTKYDAKDGKCVACQNGYVLSDKALCQMRDINCLQYDTSNTKCIQCSKGYYNDRNGRCQYSDQHCSSFDQDGLCINCDRLYFLNPYGKCQLRDPQCDTYTNGMCSQCRPYYFVKEGYCVVNMAGCQIQQNYGKCLKCQQGYTISNGQCRASITKLTWNDVDMDFWGEEEDQNKKKESQNVFSVGVNSKLNLDAALQSGKGSLFYSSWALNNASAVITAQGNNGWSTSNNAQGQYIGFKAQEMQTWYALDLKQLTGSSLKSFTLQYSMDGINFLKIDTYTLPSITIDTISTFYFKPVYGHSVRLVVNQGTPNIRIQFYYSSAEQSSSVVRQDSFISKTVVASVDGVEQGGISECGKSGLCWAGVEACQPKNITGFGLVYQGGANGKVNEVKIQYSTDGIKFNCYNDCQAIPLTNDGLNFPTPLLAQKMHVHFSKYTGQPKFGVKFNFA